MGDDDYFPQPVTEAKDHSSAATGGQNIFINNLGKTGFTIIIALVGLSVGLAISAIVIVIVCGAMDRESATQKALAAEKRATDIAWLAKQEASLLREDVMQLRVELAKRGYILSDQQH